MSPGAVARGGAVGRGGYVQWTTTTTSPRNMERESGGCSRGGGEGAVAGGWRLPAYYCTWMTSAQLLPVNDLLLFSF